MVLYNGVYGDFDISSDPQASNILRGLECRKKYLGQQIGDFEIVTVDYDFGLHKPINTARCVLCGMEKEIPNLADFARGKGVARLCRCRYKKEEKPKPRKPEERIGEEHHGFRILDYRRGLGYRVECLTCGKQMWYKGGELFDGKRTCNHKRVNDYFDPEWIGKRVGNLVAIHPEGELFRFRCDCGTEVVRRPTDVFRLKGASARTCGRKECEYHVQALLCGKDKRMRGLAFEYECAKIVESQGFDVEMTPSTGDFGVDFFAVVDGERVAFQCKKLKVDSVVHAVQEVYAGGCYYDCRKFVVVSPSGFTYPAEVMASKLGVQLETDLSDFHLKTGERMI